MSIGSRNFFKSILSRLRKSSFINNTSSVIERASNKAQNQLDTIQHAAAVKYNTVVKQINGTTIIENRDESPIRQPAPIPDGLMNIWRWYQQLTGLQDVEFAQKKVIFLQDKLFKCQDERRNLTNVSIVIAEKLKEIYGELLQTKRDDPKYVQLTIMENKGLQEQSRINSQLKLLEDTERDHFTQLATAIKEYHDSQAMNAQKYKYLSILASAILAIVSLCGSMIYNDRRIRDVRNVIAEAQLKNETLFKKYFSILLTHTLENERMNKKNINYGNGNFEKKDNSLKPVPLLNTQHDDLTDNIFTTRNICIGLLVLIFAKMCSS